MKLCPIIEYGSPIWTTNINTNVFHEIRKMQIYFLRKTNKYGPRACHKAILFDLAIEDINLRIYSTKEKYVIKCKLGLVPETIMKLYNQRNTRYAYESKIKYDPELETGYPNVVKHKGKTKYKSHVVYIDKRRTMTKNFFFNSAKKCELERKKGINKNIELWSQHVRPKETVFGLKSVHKRYVRNAHRT